jgi:hypothetical protein
MIEKTIDKSFHNIFELQLKNAGYKWFPDNWKKSIRGFQKRFDDEKGTKYFITGYHYNLKKQGIDSAPGDDRYSFDCQFTINKDGKSQTIDVQFSGDFLRNDYDRAVTTLKDAEDFYEKLWKDMECEYYELKDY